MISVQRYTELEIGAMQKLYIH